jgi:hypothetical protein
MKVHGCRWNMTGEILQVAEGRSARGRRRQHRLRHGSATTTLNTCSRPWPDREGQTRAAVGAVLPDHADKFNDAESNVRTVNGPVT